MKKTFLYIMILLLMVSCQQNDNLLVSSPNGQNTITISLNDNGEIYYAVTHADKVVLTPSRLGLRLRDAEDLTDHFELISTTRDSHDETWQPVWGEESEIRCHYNELRLHLRQRGTVAPDRTNETTDTVEGDRTTANQSRDLYLVFRVFDDGFGFRYEFPRQDNLQDFIIADEITEFAFPADHDAWSIPADGPRFYEALFEKRPLSQLGWASTPVTIETQDGLFLAIHEANLTDYAAMNLKNFELGVRNLDLDIKNEDLRVGNSQISNPNCEAISPNSKLKTQKSVTLHAELTPWSNGDKVRVTNTRHSPWRTMIIAENAGDLLLSRIMLNLNEPCALDDVSWIQPMRYIGIWWDYHMKNSTWEIGPKHGATTANVKRYMDFAADNGFGGVLVEGWNYDWATWKFSFTKAYEDFDIQAITDYGKQKGVQLIGHHETGGAVANYEAQMEDGMALYERYGMHNVKTGYVGDLMEGERHSSQYAVLHYRSVVEAAARHKLCVDNHEPVIPTGLCRTYPNFMTQEGVRGREWDAWCPDGGNPPSHTATLPFTRGLAGPMDFTPATFSFVNPVMPQTRVMTTLAKQLAEFVVLYSPMQMASDRIENYQANPAPFSFITSCPTDWAKTVVPEAKIGEYITIVRKDKHSDSWFIGSLTNENARTAHIALNFLDKGATYTVTIYQDGENADYEANPTDIQILTRIVTADDILDIPVARGGGLAIRIEKCQGEAIYNRLIMQTDAYTWNNDTIIQGSYKAWAENDYHIVSTYHAQPHYYMPIEQEWQLKNDITPYPHLYSSNRLHNAIHNMGLDEMINAVEPDTTLRTGKEWAGVWTRDVSYSIILSMAYMQPLASEISLRKKVNANGRIIQDTGSGGAWPVSTDRMIWAVAAYELYKATGSQEWLQFAYPVIKNSIEDDFLIAYSESGLVKGETSFIDWREQSYPRWMQTVDIYQSEAMNTSVVHAIALDVLAQMAAELGYPEDATRYAERAENLKTAINKHFWMPDKGYYAMYRYGREHLILNPRAETLGESLAILYDIAPADRQKSITEHNPTTPYGSAIFYPQIADMPAYHNNALWPWVGAMWALANAKVGNEQGTLEAIGAIFRPAALFCTNKENFNLDNGDIATELNSSNMLWCLAGNLALTYRILFGIHFEPDGLVFKPFIPKDLADTRRLTNFTYRNAKLNITISGYGSQIASFKLDGKETTPIIPTDLTGVHEIEIIVSRRSGFQPLKVNHVANLKAPITPICQFSPPLEGSGEVFLSWQPIEYIHHYIVLRNGERVKETTQTRYPLTQHGEYQVIGVAADGTESFASEPMCYQPTLYIEMPNETKTATSKEIAYQPKTPIEGYHGDGFAEIDHTSAPITLTVDIPEEGDYALSLIYANGNGSVNTENKCAIRTLSVDNQRVGVFVMPHRGVANWNDWGHTNCLQVHLTEGTHTFVIDYRPENENMNLHTNHALIDCMILHAL